MLSPRRPEDSTSDEAWSVASAQPTVAKGSRTEAPPPAGEIKGSLTGALKRRRGGCTRRQAAGRLPDRLTTSRCERAGFAVAHLAKRMPQLPAWVRRERQPTLKQLAKLTHTPLGYLFFSTLWVNT